MVEYAYAKLNLTLEIIRRLQDGYHEIFSVFQKISLKDRIYLENSFMDEIAFSQQVHSRITTVHLARDLFRGASSVIEPVNISVRKSIPVGSGLGGESSDTKATLSLMNRFFGNPLSEEGLIDLGKKIGSDVPFFFNGPTAFVSGKGDVVESIASLKKCFVVFIVPDFHSPTKIAYDLFDRFGVLSGGEKTTKLVSILKGSYNIESLNNSLYNDFEVLFKQSDNRYKRLFDHVEHISGVKFHLTGSGSSIFSLFESKEKAEKISYKLKKVGYKNTIAETI
jgi:4-diphosphocytidyl-2-C-methyl-D-erythritol kinase